MDKQKAWIKWMKLLGKPWQFPDCYLTHLTHKSNQDRSANDRGRTIYNVNPFYDEGQWPPSEVRSISRMIKQHISTNHKTFVDATKDSKIVYLGSNTGNRPRITPGCMWMIMRRRNVPAFGSYLSLYLEIIVVFVVCEWLIWYLWVFLMCCIILSLRMLRLFSRLSAITVEFLKE